MKAVWGILLAIGLMNPVIAADKTDPTPGLEIALGQTLVFQLADGQPVKVRVDTGAALQPGELQASLQTAEGGTMLHLMNNTSAFLDYQASIQRGPGQAGQHTSVCTLLNNGRSGFELWPYAIPVLRLSDFTPTSADAIVCKQAGFRLAGLVDKDAHCTATLAHSQRFSPYLGLVLTAELGHLLTIWKAQTLS
jgi:hypothetical protein